MNDQRLQNLLQSAYQCELPSSDAVERFIEEFHRRQSLLANELSFFEKIQKQLADFFSHFHIPVIAYAGATAVAIFVSVLILRSPRLNQYQGINPLVSEELEAPLNYVVSPSLKQRIEPVTFELKKKNDDSGDVISPLSFILKRKSSSTLKNF